MSNTPRTDAAKITCDGNCYGGEYVTADFARQLERENAELRAALQKCHNELMGADQHVPSATWQIGIRTALDQARRALEAK